nr:hypothetical protein [Candidatus Cloacimonadota bacterium]
IILGSDYYNVWTQYGIQVNMLDNNSFFTWQLIQGDEAVLRHQCLDQSGNLLFPGDGIDL